MSAAAPKNWGIFGGAGFIGQHLALSILQKFPQDRVYLLDLVTPSQSTWKVPLESYADASRLVALHCDVRDKVQLLALDTRFDVIVNLAAIHREPGHRTEEYFETNISGAENLCDLATRTGCSEIVFTSSISVYGIHDRPVDESTQTQPYSPYGQSKLKAEQIHIKWAKQHRGKLNIIRPGVVFGPGEVGNVTRLVREMINRKRPIELQPDQAKAGIYVNELIEVIHWLRNRELTAGEHQLVNGVSHELLTFNAFGTSLKETRQFDAKPLKLPTALIRTATTMMRPLSALMPSKSRFHPERLAKIYRPNDIRPAALTDMGYTFSWSLNKALTDWLNRGL